MHWHGADRLVRAAYHRGARHLFHPAQIPAVIGLSLAAVAVHEFAHALVVVHHGRRVDADVHRRLAPLRPPAAQGPR